MKQIMYDGAKWLTIGSAGAAGGGFTLLWENPNPTTSTTGLTASCSPLNYDFLLVEYRRGTASGATGTKIDIMAAEDGNTSTMIMRAAGSTNTIYSRQATISSSGVTFANGYSGTSAGGGNCVPTRIWGVKL